MRMIQFGLGMLGRRVEKKGGNHNRSVTTDDVVKTQCLRKLHFYQTFRRSCTIMCALYVTIIYSPQSRTHVNFNKEKHIQFIVFIYLTL